MKAIIVDDDRTYRTFARTLLERRGMTAYEAGDGSTALHLLRLHGPVHLILVDWHMEPMNGYSLVRAVRDSPIGRTVPIIMMTSELGTAHRQMAQEAGVCYCLTKPLTAETLMGAVDHCLTGDAADPKPTVWLAKRLLDEVGPAAWKELAAEFLVQMASFLAQLSPTIAANNHPRSVFIAHRLAGSAAMFELVDFQQACRDLERGARAGEAPAVANANRRLQVEAVQARATIEEQVARL